MRKDLTTEQIKTLKTLLADIDESGLGPAWEAARSAIDTAYTEENSSMSNYITYIIMDDAGEIDIVRMQSNEERIDVREGRSIRLLTVREWDGNDYFASDEDARPTSLPEQVDIILGDYPEILEDPIEELEDAIRGLLADAIEIED